MAKQKRAARGVHVIFSVYVSLFERGKPRPSLAAACTEDHQMDAASGGDKARAVDEYDEGWMCTTRVRKRGGSVSYVAGR